MKALTIDQLVRSNIKALKPYQSARKEYTASNGIFLDANENPFGELNRYPDPQQLMLKTKLAALKETSIDSIFIGNGSDEIIDLAIRIFCEPEKDKIIICKPTYGMYEVCANINNVRIINIPLKPEFQPDKEKIINCGAKILFLCSPNNPTGNSLIDLESIISEFNGIVFLDEAYIDFSSSPSLLKKLRLYPNLIISQTLSKAWAGAAIRTGVAFSSPEIINYFNKIKPPYNVSNLNQMAALEILSKKDEMEYRVKIIVDERQRIAKELANTGHFSQIYDSDANFLLVACSDAEYLHNYFKENGVIIRNRSSEISNTLRISIGKPEENDKLLFILNKYINEKSTVY